MPHNMPQDVHVVGVASMPGKVEHRGDKWILVWGDREFEHDTKEDAQAQMRLLYSKEPEAKSARTREYLEAFHEHARRQLPGWQADMIHSAAMPSSGGRAGQRRPQHTAIEAALLRKMAPDQLSDLDDDELVKAWGELSLYHKQATKKKMDTESYERAGSFCAQELHRRGLSYDQESPLAKAAICHNSVAARVQMLPAEILISKAAGLVRVEGGIGLIYDPALGDDGLITGALANVGVFCRSADAADLDDQEQIAVLYDLILRRPGLEREEGEPLVLVAGGATHGAIPLSKSMKEKRCIWYVAAEPDEPDTYGHKITADEIEDQAHRFMLGPRRVFMEHGDIQGLNATSAWPRELTGKAYTVESALLPCATGEFFGVEAPRTIKMGSWIVCNYYPDARLWEMLSNTPHGISWRGFAAKEQR